MTDEQRRTLTTAVEAVRAARAAVGEANAMLHGGLTSEGGEGVHVLRLSRAAMEEACALMARADDQATTSRALAGGAATSSPKVY